MTALSIVSRSLISTRSRPLLALFSSTLALGLAAPASAGGPPRDVFEDNDRTWGCFGDDDAPVPPHHCINLKSNGSTGLILTAVLRFGRCPTATSAARSSTGLSLPPSP